MATPVLHRETRMQRGSGDPFRDLEQMQRAALQLLQSTFGAQVPDGMTWSPPVDIEETDDAWIIEAEIPGAKRDDVNIEAHDNEVEISGEIVEREREGIVRRRTRRVGRFEFRVTLPGQIEAEQIDAGYNDGVLTVRVPKSEKARPRRVEIRDDGQRAA